jgi:hypothetical protein
MSTPTEQPRRSRLTQAMRLSPAPIVLLGLAGGALMAFGAFGPPEVTVRDRLWTAGTTMLAVSGVFFCVVLWGGVYLNVVEASRGMPGLRAVEEPVMPPDPAAGVAALKQSLTGLGFRPAGWFSLGRSRSSCTSRRAACSGCASSAGSRTGASSSARPD